MSCTYKAIFCKDVQRHGLHIYSVAILTYGYHIHMSLKDDPRLVFISGSCGFLVDHISMVICDVFDTALFSESDQVVPYHLKIVGTVGDPGDLLKEVKYFFRL